MIIKDEYEEDVGGGVSQVATTVFNAAWEAGLKIAERNPHSLYISRYQPGRDATVNYPDLDLKFVNDTQKWICVPARPATPGSPSPSTAAAQTGASRAATGAAPRDGPGADAARQGPDAARAARRWWRRTARRRARPSRHPDGLRRERQGPARRDLEHDLPRRDRDDPRRHEAEAEAEAEAAAEGPKKPSDAAAGPAGHEPGAEPAVAGADAASAVATASANHAGTRVGRRVAASTVACAVEPSATSSPLPLDRVLVAEARAADVDAARPDPQAVVEVGARW